MILSGFVSAAKEVSRDAVRVIALLVLVGITALSAVGFLTAAVFWALSQEIGSIGAALCLALVYCVIALVLFIIAHNIIEQSVCSFIFCIPSRGIISLAFFYF